MDLYGFIWSYMGLITVFKCVLLKWTWPLQWRPSTSYDRNRHEKNLDGTWDWFCLRSTWRKKTGQIGYQWVGSVSGLKLAKSCIINGLVASNWLNHGFIMD